MAHDVLENGICVDCRPQDHQLDNGECVACRSMASRGHFDPSLHPHDPHNGKFVTTAGVLGALLPDDANLFDTEKDWHRYDELYDVLDEMAVSGFAAISMANGEAQVAFDDGNHRYVLADTDPAGMRDLADTIEKLADEFENHFDPTEDPGSEYKVGDLVDYLPWGEDEELVIGFDAVGDFRFTAKDADGKPFDLPELTIEQAQEYADALREQADTAEEQG